MLCLAGCLSTSADAAPCPPGLEPQARVELFFGRNIGEMIGVSEAAWQSFVDEVVTPRFPAGLSVVDINGQWRDQASGRIVREPGKLMVLIVTADQATRAHLTAIIADYKKRHSQQSVLMTEQAVCVAF